MERYRQFHVVEISPSLDSMYRNEHHGEHIEDDPMVNRTHTAFERAESEEFLSWPDFVDSKRVLAFFLLHSLFMKLGWNLVSIDIVK